MENRIKVDNDIFRKESIDAEGRMIAELFGETVKNSNTRYTEKFVPIDKLNDADSEINKYDKLDDTEFIELVQSIHTIGLFHPIVCIENHGNVADTSYMIISGHNRVRAYKELYKIEKSNKFKQIKAVVFKFDSLNRNEMRNIAISINDVQRSSSNRKKAMAIRYRYDYLKSLPENSRKDITKMLSSEYDMGKKQIERYKALTNLIPEIQKLLDGDTKTGNLFLNIKQGVSLSTLESDIQHRLYLDYMKNVDDLLLLKKSLSKISKLEKKDSYMEIKNIIENIKEDSSDEIAVSLIYTGMDKDKSLKEKRVKFKMDKIDAMYLKNFFDEKFEESGISLEI